MRHELINFLNTVILFDYKSTKPYKKNHKEQVLHLGVTIYKYYVEEDGRIAKSSADVDHMYIDDSVYKPESINTIIPYKRRNGSYDYGIESCTPTPRLEAELKKQKALGLKYLAQSNSDAKIIEDLRAQVERERKAREAQLEKERKAAEAKAKVIEDLRAQAERERKARKAQLEKERKAAEAKAKVKTKAEADAEAWYNAAREGKFVDDCDWLPLDDELGVWQRLIK